MLFYIIQTNYTEVLTLVFFYIFLFTMSPMNKKQFTSFLTAAIIVTVLVIADSADYWLEMTQKTVSPLRYVTSATGYALRPAAILVTMTVAKPLRKYERVISLILLIFNGVVAYGSVFNQWMFGFDEKNQFFRGPLGLTPFVVCAIFLLLLIRTSREQYSMGNRSESILLAMIAMALVLGCTMETGFKYKFCVNASGTVAMVFYYLFFHTQKFKRDAMTGAYNRHSFYADWMKMSDKQMIIVSMDLNNLKTINDSQGHDAGDLAINTVSKAAFSNMPRKARFYRMGGDEFTILFPETSEEGATMVMREISKEVVQGGYQVAWGLAYYKPHSNFEEAFNLSDERMYQNKKQMKQLNME